jgi:hypothetical protein
MADAPVVSEDDIADVNLVTTPIAPPPSDSKPSAPADNKPNDGADTQGKPAEDAAKPDAKGTEAKDTPPATPATDPNKPAADDKKPEDGDQNKPDDQKAADDKDQQLTPEEQREQQRARAQQEYQNRQRTKTQVANQLDQDYGPKTEEELVNEGLEPADAKIEALRQEMAYKEQRTQIAELNAGMQAEAVNAINDFGVFNPKSGDYDEQYTKEVEQAYRVAARLQVDEKSGIILNAEVPLYNFYQQMANIYNRGASKGAQQGQQEMQQMLSRTENPGGSSSTNGSQGDSLEALEERLGNVVIT